jgi:hypothetical protein
LFTDHVYFKRFMSHVECTRGVELCHFRTLHRCPTPDNGNEGLRLAVDAISAVPQRGFNCRDLIGEPKAHLFVCSVRNAYNLTHFLGEAPPYESDFLSYESLCAKFQGRIGLVDVARCCIFSSTIVSS